MLTYDENDGYFDHVPPFVAPHPRQPETGRVTKGIDPGVEYVELAEDRSNNRGAGAGKLNRPGFSRADGHRLSLEPRRLRLFAGLRPHFRPAVPGNLLSHRPAKNRGNEHHRWRRTVCGDLTASFQATAEQTMQIAGISAHGTPS